VSSELAEQDADLIKLSEATGISPGDLNMMWIQYGCKNKGTTIDQFRLFMMQVARSKLEPGKQIYMSTFKNSDSNTPDIVIDYTVAGVRLIAQRTGEFLGCSDAIHGPWIPDSKCTGGGHPEWTKVIARRNCRGVVSEYPATVYWDEFFPGDHLGFLWKKRPRWTMEQKAEKWAIKKGKN